MPLGNHLVYDLLRTADHLLDERSGRANLLKAMRRRAISSAYYAVFQGVCFVVADVSIGWSSDAALLDPIFRTPDHRQVRDKLSKSKAVNLKRLGIILAQLQDLRHEADYSPPSYSPTHPEAFAIVQQARDAVRLIEDLDAEERRVLTVTLLAKPR